MELQAGSEMVTLTADHPFPTDIGVGRGASSRIGDKMVGVDGFKQVSLVRLHRQSVSVFDFSPADANSYFVGPGDGLVIYESDSL